MIRLIQKIRHGRLYDKYRRDLLKEARDAAIKANAFDLIETRNSVREAILDAEKREDGKTVDFYKGQLATIDWLLTGGEVARKRD